MPFTGETELKVFDLLTVTVMVEQCEPSLTMVRYPVARTQFAGGYKRLVLEPEQTCCMACVMNMTELRRTQEPRTALLNAVRLGNTQILNIRLREDGERCRRCQAHLTLVNGQWQSDFLPPSTT